MKRLLILLASVFILAVSVSPLSVAAYGPMDVTIGGMDTIFVGGVDADDDTTVDIPAGDPLYGPRQQ